MTNPITLGEFWTEVVKTQNDFPQWRPGQTAFNVLCEYRPDLSEQVRATQIDPFFSKSVMPAFAEWIRDNWESK